MRLAEQPFLVPSSRGARPLVYAPLTGLLLEVNDAGLSLIERLSSSTLDVQRGDQQMIDQLRSLGLLPGTSAPELNRLPSDSGVYTPTTVTLFLTRKCNLRCEYCYAEGGATNDTMSPEILRAAIELIVENGKRSEAEAVEVIFHGSGEPTMAMSLLRQGVALTRNRCEASGLSVRFSIGTNGVMSADTAEWLARSMDNITVSIDGPPEIQDAQRPTRAGGGSASSVVRTLGRLDALGACYGLRVTITAATVNRIPEIVDYLCRISSAPAIKLEPVELSGRGATFHAVDPQSFVMGFLAAKAVADHYDRELDLAGTDPDQIAHQYCALGQCGFTVTETGRASACYETAQASDPRCDRFTVGGYRSGMMELSPSAALDLRDESLHVKLPCKSCWARYSCAGDCHAKVARLGDPERVVDRRRCYAIREIARARILERYGFGWPAAPSQTIEDYLGEEHD